MTVEEQAIDAVLSAMGMKGTSGVSGPGLTGFAVFGDWAEKLRQLLGQWWWLIIAAGVALLIMND